MACSSFKSVILILPKSGGKEPSSLIPNDCSSFSSLHQKVINCSCDLLVGKKIRLFCGEDKYDGAFSAKFTQNYNRTNDLSTSTITTVNIVVLDLGTQ